MIVCVFCFVAAGDAAWAAAPGTPSQVILSPPARASFERGLAAVKTAPPNWDLAITSFAAVPQAQPDAIVFPPLLLNLGLAHAGAGHEMAALYWLQAYLVAAPHADNGPAVRQVVARLHAALEDKIATILDHAQRIVRALPDAVSRDALADEVEIARARFHALTKRDIATAVLARPGQASYLWEQYGKLLAALGDVDGALAAVAKIAPTPAFTPWRISGERYVGRRDDLRVAILDALDTAPDRARQQAILGAMDDKARSLNWEVDDALRRDRAAEAIALAAKITNVETRDAALARIADYILEADWKHPSGVSLARDVFAKMAPGTRARTSVGAWLIESFLAADDMPGARAVAQDVETGLGPSDIPAIVHIVLDHRDVMSKARHSPFYFQISIRYHVLRGEFDEARRLADAARRELAAEALAEENESEPAVFAYALAKRISGLLSRGRLDAARIAAARFSHDPCDKDEERATTQRRVTALRRLAEEEIARKELDAAAATIRSMPRPADNAELVSGCVVEKAEALAGLARGYVAAGRSKDAASVAADAESLVWRGALYRPVLEALARAREDLGDASGAAAIRRMDSFIPLTYWVWGARIFSAIPVVIDLPGALRKIASGGGGTSGGRARPDVDAARGIVDVASRLSAWLQDYDVSLGRAGGRRPWP